MKLLWRALMKFLVGFALLSGLIFLPAGTFAYPHAWLFFAVLFLPMLLLGIFLYRKQPQLLEKRLSHREKEKTQQGVIALSALMFPAGFVIAALDFRFSWSVVPTWCVIAASISFLLGYAMYAEVMRENAFLSRTVEVQQNQYVIDTGLYGVVRHPMYLATLLMFLPLSLILGSLWGLIPFALYPIILVVRLLDEEKMLMASLDGYATYCQKVKYHLIPLIW